MHSRQVYFLFSGRTALHDWSVFNDALKLHCGEVDTFWDPPSM